MCSGLSLLLESAPLRFEKGLLSPILFLLMGVVSSKEDCGEGWTSPTSCSLLAETRTGAPMSTAAFGPIEISERMVVEIMSHSLTKLPGGGGGAHFARSKCFRIRCTGRS